jgi:hypothetical protein
MLSKIVVIGPEREGIAPVFQHISSPRRPFQVIRAQDPSGA